MSSTELTLKFSSCSDVNVCFDGTESGQLDFVNPVTDKDRADIRWYIETYGSASLAEPDDQEAKRIQARLIDIGKALFTDVFHDRAARRLFDRFQDADSQYRVLTISSQNALILSLPWELLHDPAGVFLFREKPHISIRRKIFGATGGRQPFRIQSKARLHLLFVVSRPNDSGFIDPRADPKAVLDALDQHAPGRVSCEFLRPATLNALVERLDDDTKPAIDIQHFDGHGVFTQVTEEEAKKHPDQYGKAILSEIQRERQARKDDASEQPVGIGFLVFENADRSKHLISAQDIGDNLYCCKVRLVILSACQSAAIDHASDPFASVAGNLTRTGIPAILAMTHSVLVATTQLLFGKFYQSLARSRGIAGAVDDARIWLANNPEKFPVRRGDNQQMLALDDWFLPALFHGGADAALLTTQAADAAEATVPILHNLRPPHEAGFFGRRRELWDIEYWFAGRETRRISITGFGGQGKTELALEAGRWLLRTGLFERAVLIDYAQVQSDDALSVAVSTIGSVIEASLSDAQAATEALAATATLVILDNLETVATESLTELLDAAVAWSTTGACRVLLTSRNPDFNHADYRIQGTRSHRRIALQGLGSAGNPEDALQWFTGLNKLPFADHHLEISPPKREELIELFDRVRFHPLSIAVLAQQLKTSSARQLGERLQQILSEDAISGIAQEGTSTSLIASLQLSLERLSDIERHAVRRLGVFQGGAFEDDLLVITGLGEADENAAEREQLVSQKAETGNLWPALRRQLEAAALIEAENIRGIRLPFLRFRPTLAPMLWSGLDSEEQARLTLAHRQRYYAVVNFLYTEDSKNPHQVRAYTLRELPNLLHAVHHTLDVGGSNAVRFVSYINWFLYVFGMSRIAAKLTQRAEKVSSERGSDAWYLLQTNRGEQLLTSGQIAAATRTFVDILQTEQPSYKLISTLCRLGRCYRLGDRPDLAEAKYRQGIAVTKELEQSDDVKRHLGVLHTDLADGLTDQGQFAAAREQYENGLMIYEELNDHRSLAVTLGQLGTLSMMEGNLTGAVQRFHEALKLFQRLNEPSSEAAYHNQLGNTYVNAKQREQAEQHYRQSASSPSHKF